MKGNTNIPTELTIVTANRVYKGFGKPLYTPNRPLVFLPAEEGMLSEFVLSVSIPIFVVCAAQRAEPFRSLIGCRISYCGFRRNRGCAMPWG